MKYLWVSSLKIKDCRKDKYFCKNQLTNVFLSRREMHKMKSETPDHRKLSVGGWRLAESGIDTNYKSLDRKKSGRNSRQQRNNSGQNNR